MISEKKINELILYIYQCIGVALKQYLKSTEIENHVYYQSTLYAYMDVLQQLIRSYLFKVTDTTDDVKDK